MRLQYKRNSNTWSYHWKRTSQDEARKDQGNQEIEGTYKNQRCGEFSRICKFLLKIHPKFQLYSKTTEQIERKKGMDMK